MKKLFIILILILFSIVGCKNKDNSEITKELNESNSEDNKVSIPLNNSSDTEFDLYNGKSLKIAVIGELPKVREEQVEFKEISFDELSKQKVNSYDAVFIMKEKFSEASESQYATIYLKSTTPYFFPATKSLIPFTSVEDIEYSNSWDWEPGLPYIHGVYKPQNSERAERLGFGLYNEEKTEEHIKATYSLVFKKIAELINNVIALTGAFLE
ncbi:hypothetical protein [Aquibacillus rhizosphaerae]|uniref:Lipoprotein n=1 Tax=Aquibacillus rhizosphaerae TaxID=3051431 RepID=A0ABT7L4E3_9BACI|nr:hypothetical protein [Aquibacillus sp. LR5S19]MDL4839466.1 hypothetical protein [Aquibacillus sp. LR5S19]